MHDQLNPDLPLDPPLEPPSEIPPPLFPIEKPARRFRRATGPTSPEGKASSSMNRLSHGCRSEKTIIPGEDPAEFEACVQAWFETYGPQDPAAARLVEETALADWFLRRNRKRLDDIERRLPYDTWQWTDENHKLFSNTMRYKTTAERSFVRSFKQLETYLRRDLQDAQIYQRAIAQSASIFMRWLRRTERSECDSMKIRQWVEVERDGNRTRTSCYPTNQQIQKRVASLRKPPFFMTRILNFPRGVPPEYAWAFPDNVQQLTSCTAQQTMFYSDWLRAIEREKSVPGGHLGSTDWLFEE